MCHKSVIYLSNTWFSEDEIKNKEIIEIWSKYYNGSIRSNFIDKSHKSYIGTDVDKGMGVDVVCKAEDLLEKYPEKQFDVVLSSETLECIEDWKKAIHVIKTLVKNGGLVFCNHTV